MVSHSEYTIYHLLYFRLLPRHPEDAVIGVGTTVAAEATTACQMLLLFCALSSILVIHCGTSMGVDTITYSNLMSVMKVQRATVLMSPSFMAGCISICIKSVTDGSLCRRIATSVRPRRCGTPPRSRAPRHLSVLSAILSTVYIYRILPTLAHVSR